MNRFSVIYQLQKQYHQFACDTQEEAEISLAKLSSQKGYTPIGIYDAKTELFSWQSDLQQRYDQATIEEQGKWGNYMIQIAQQLRQHNTEQHQANSLNQILSISEA